MLQSCQLKHSKKTHRTYLLNRIIHSIIHCLVSIAAMPPSSELHEHINYCYLYSIIISWIRHVINMCSIASHDTSVSVSFDELFKRCFV